MKQQTIKLYVVRHGKTDFNVEGRYAGSTDVPLNKTGISQAEELADKLKLSDMKFDVVISSPLLRARQTADIVCSALKNSYVIIEQFAERNVGVYEGLTQREAMKKYPELWRRQCTRQLDDAPTKGETIRQFDARIIDGLDILRRDYKNKRVLLIAHGFVSRAINRYCMNLSFDEMHSFLLDNCEVAEYNL